MGRERAVVIIGGAAILSGALGTVHAFSVFVAPLEAAFGAGRDAVSLTYGIALAALTSAVLVGPRVFGRVAPVRLALGVGLMAALGALVAAAAPGFWAVWLGYGLIFGFANGLGYGFGLQVAAQAAVGREGVAMGVVTAAYALGAALGAPFFESALTGGLGAGFWALGAATTAAGVAAAALFAIGHARWRGGVAAAEFERSDGLRVSRLWLGYGAGAAAGLMAIGHAAPLAEGLGVEAAWRAPAVIAVANLCGSLAGGAFADGRRRAAALAAPPVLSALGLAALAMFGASVLFPALAVIGFAYGALIAAYPSVIAKISGPASAGVYGRVFTAWGLAGLTAPAAAGAIFEATGEYAAALIAAAALAVVAAFAGFFAAPRDP